LHRREQELREERSLPYPAATDQAPLPFVMWVPLQGLQGSCPFCPKIPGRWELELYFTDEETEPQSSAVTCSRSRPVGAQQD
jgi:hypothetical protein